MDHLFLFPSMLTLNIKLDRAIYYYTPNKSILTMVLEKVNWWSSRIIVWGCLRLIFQSKVIARSIKKYQNKNNCVQLCRIYMVIFNCIKIVRILVFVLDCKWTKEWRFTIWWNIRFFWSKQYFLSAVFMIFKS